MMVATGNVTMPVLLSNQSSSTCVLDGFPDIAVLDASGGVLAQAAGTTGRGTYFPDGAVVPILLRSGGQATMNVSWYDCTHPQASQLALDLPDKGGRLLVPFPVSGRYFALCDTDPHYSSLSRGHFSPVGVETSPAPSYIPFNATIETPPSAKAGSTLTYFVTLRNRGTAAYVLTPCPDYIEILGLKSAVADYRLNCRPVGVMAPGATLKFEMRIPLPARVQAGTSEIRWVLSDGRVGFPQATAPVAIT
jgi:hypothetical protein